MHSVLKLVHLPSRGSKDAPGINGLARKAELKGRGSMTKAEKIIALADEELSPEAREIVLASSKDLSRRARKAGVDGYSKLTKSQLQEHFLKEILEAQPSEHGHASSNGAASGATPNARRLEADVSEAASFSTARSHFASDEERRRAIHQAAQKALGAALKEKRSYVVVESFRTQDKTQPLSIQPAYMQRHENTRPVCEILIPHLAHRQASGA